MLSRALTRLFGSFSFRSRAGKRYPEAILAEAARIAHRPERALIVLSISLACGAARAELVDRIVAIIDRDVITLSEAERAQQIASLRDPEPASLSQIVDRLVERTLVEREVDRFSSEPVPEEMLDRAFTEVRERFGSQADFLDAVSRLGLSQDELKAELRRQLRVARYLEKRFRALTYVSADDVERFYEEELLPELPPGAPRPDIEEYRDAVRQILEERQFNERVDQWIEELTSRASIRRYVW